VAGVFVDLEAVIDVDLTQVTGQVVHALGDPSVEVGVDAKTGRLDPREVEIGLGHRSVAHHERAQGLVVGCVTEALPAAPTEADHSDLRGIDRIQTEVDWDQFALLEFFARSGFRPAARLCLELALDRPSE